MKKCLVVFLLAFPIIAGAAPSVRLLGSKNANDVAAVNSNITAAKTASASSIVKSNQTTPVRVGTTSRAKTSGASGAITSSGSRFPVMTSPKNYTTATDASIPVVSGLSDGVVETIVNSVTQRIEGDIVNNYYSKTEVYNNNEFTEAVKSVDDPRIDAVRTRNPAALHSGNALPSDYIYFWIER